MCSEHFTIDSYRRPPGLKERPLLKRGIIPNRFDSYPAHLQPPSEKRRRLLTRTASAEPEVETDASQLIEETPDTNAESPITSHGESPSTASTPSRPWSRPVGRPIQSPSIRIPILRQRVNTLKKKVTRLERKLDIQQNLLQVLQQENKLQSAKLSSIDGCLSELVENQAKNIHRKTKKDFSDRIKEFAITMHYYSPKAYEYLRENFRLPTSRTIRRWLETVDCEPGFLSDVIKSVNVQNGDNLYSLVVDSMSIRKKLVVDNSNTKVLSHVTIGDTSKLAGEALVFLLVPILGGIRFPIGYFFVEKIDSDLQSQLIKECLKLTAEENITVINVTCDGCQLNLSTLKKLDANIPSKTSFKHPSQDHDVYVTLDPVHMMKLGRNAFGTYRQFKSSSGTINYKYVEELVNM